MRLAMNRGKRDAEYGGGMVNSSFSVTVFSKQPQSLATVHSLHFYRTRGRLWFLALFSFPVRPCPTPQ